MAIISNGVTVVSGGTLVTKSGNTAGRPATPSIGTLYLNTETNSTEIYRSSGWSDISPRLGSIDNPALSGIALKNAGFSDGWYYIRPNGQASAYRMYVDNTRNGGGWVCCVRATRASGQAHSNNSAVNFDGVNGPNPSAASASKVSDAWMNSLRGSSTYTGSTAYWMEAPSWTNGATNKHMFISSSASVDTVASASDQDARTNVSTTFEGSISNRDPNTGTRGFGDHHTSSGTYFAYMRHPEQGTNYGFSEDALGQADGVLWIK